MENGRIEPVLQGMMQKDAIDDLPGIRIEAEADIAQTHVRERAGQLLLDALNGIQSLQRAVAKVFLARRYWEDQRIEQQIGRRYAEFLGADVINPLRHLEFPVGRGR